LSSIVAVAGQGIKAGRRRVGFGNCQGRLVGPGIRCGAAVVVTVCAGVLGRVFASAENMRLEVSSLSGVASVEAMQLGQV
jgi:hypothetical protein